VVRWRLTAEHPIDTFGVVGGSTRATDTEGRFVWSRHAGIGVVMPSGPAPGCHAPGVAPGLHSWVASAGVFHNRFASGAQALANSESSAGERAS
jgi:hypothetical protein